MPPEALFSKQSLIINAKASQQFSAGKVLYTSRGKVLYIPAEYADSSRLLTSRS
jgi:hypothetical protein